MKLLFALTFFFIPFLPLVAQKAELTAFLKELRAIEKTHISLDDALIEKTFEKVGAELVEAVLYEMKNTPYIWVIKESLNIAKVIGSHPKNSTSVFPIILFGLEDLNAEIRQKALLSMRLLKDHLSSKDLGKASPILANILCYDNDASTRNTCVKTVQILEMKNLISALIIVLKQGNPDLDMGGVVSALKKVTEVSTIYGVDVGAWEKWYNQNKLAMGAQVNPVAPPEYKSPAFFMNVDTSNPKAVLLSFAQCLKEKNYPTVYRDLMSRRDEKKGKEQTEQDRNNYINRNSSGMFYYRRYYERFFQRFERDHKDAEAVVEKINANEAFVEYTMEQFLPDDRFSYVKVALEFELIRIFVDHNMANDDKPEVKEKKKSEANKKILQWLKEVKAITNQQALSQFFLDWYKKQYADKKEMPPIRQFYVLYEFEKKNIHLINDLLPGDFTGILTTSRGYEFYYCIHSKWQIQILR
ncbi:MAG: hypothetical protein AABZ60_12260 [Planctomycetota bacterium]